MQQIKLQLHIGAQLQLCALILFRDVGAIQISYLLTYLFTVFKLRLK